MFLFREKFREPYIIIKTVLRMFGRVLIILTITRDLGDLSDAWLLKNLQLRARYSDDLF